MYTANVNITFWVHRKSGGTPLTPVRALEALDALTALDGIVWGFSRYASYLFENFTETNLDYSESRFQPKTGYFIKLTLP